MNETEEPLKFSMQGAVKIGTGFKDGEDIFDALSAGGYHMSASSKDALSTSAFKTSKIAHEVKIVNVSVAELGFMEGATVKDIYIKATQLGLLLCPAEVAPQMLLQSLERRDEWVRVAMEPIVTMTGVPVVLSVGDEHNQLWLGTYNAHPESFWLSKERCIFLKRN